MDGANSDEGVTEIWGGEEEGSLGGLVSGRGGGRGGAGP